MKKAVSLFTVFLCSLCFSQKILLTEVKAAHDNNDKLLYAFAKAAPESQYLGRIEVIGYSSRDEEVFAEIYRKAKTIGANSYILRSPEGIDGTAPFNPSRYSLLLYHTPSSQLSSEDTYVYFINADKEAQLRINNNRVMLPERSFLKYDLSKDEKTDISVGRLLGSRIKLQYRPGQPAQYFLITGNRLSPNQAEPGIRFKSGDFIKLEKSFALFLMSIYREN